MPNWPSLIAQRTLQCDAPLCLMMLLTASRRMRVVCTKPRAGSCWSVSSTGLRQSISMLAWPSRDTVSARQSASASGSRSGLPVRPRTDRRISSSASRASVEMRS